VGKELNLDTDARFMKLHQRIDALMVQMAEQKRQVSLLRGRVDDLMIEAVKRDNLRSDTEAARKKLTEEWEGEQE